MDQHAKLIIEQFQLNLEVYNKILEIAKSELSKITQSLGIETNSIEGRVKTEKSLIGKLDLKGYKYKNIFDITDIVGVRVVTFYSDQIDLIAAKVATVFNVDWDRSIDKRKALKVDQFGYKSLHYICFIPKEVYFDENNPNINLVPIEIQIRTILQHTWAAIAHDTGYKNDVEVPVQYLRSLNRLSGLLELADEQFLQIRTSLDAYRRKIIQIVKTGKLEEADLNRDSFAAYLETRPFDEINNRIASIHNMEIEEVSLFGLLKIYKDCGFTTLKEVDDLVKNYSDKAYEFAIHQFEDTDIDIITSFTGPANLLNVYGIMHENYSENDLRMALDYVYGPRKSNASIAKRYYQIAITMGIAKGTK